MYQPDYTSSELFVVRLSSLKRTFFPASHKPRYVVGLRTYDNKELARSPFNALIENPGLVKPTFITLVDAVTMATCVRGLPSRFLSNNYIAGATKAASSRPAFGTGPVVWPLQYRGLIDLGASWIYNADTNPDKDDYLFVEVFYNDAWPR